VIGAPILVFKSDWRTKKRLINFLGTLYSY